MTAYPHIAGAAAESCEVVGFSQNTQWKEKSSQVDNFRNSEEITKAKNSNISRHVCSYCCSYCQPVWSQKLPNLRAGSDNTLTEQPGAGERNRPDFAAEVEKNTNKYHSISFRHFCKQNGPIPRNLALAQVWRIIGISTSTVRFQCVML